MVFERTITVNGHSYKYLVMNVRDGTKVKQKVLKYLGRADKEYESPYGLYYFAQEDCEACESKEQVEHTLYYIQKGVEEKLPVLHYVNLASDKNPLDIDIEYTPTAIEITPTKFFKAVGSSMFNSWSTQWLNWRYGKEKGKSINDASYAAYHQEREEIIQHSKDGKDTNWLKRKGYNELTIISARDELRRGKVMERRRKREEEAKRMRDQGYRQVANFDTNHKLVWKWVKREQDESEQDKCKDGVCQV